MGAKGIPWKGTLESPRDPMGGDSWEPKGSHGRGPLGAPGIPWEGTQGIPRDPMGGDPREPGDYRGLPRISLEAAGVFRNHFGGILC